MTAELAGATRPCPDCVGCLQDHQDDAVYTVPGTCACKTCHGTGRVGDPMLPGGEVEDDD